MNEPKTDEVVVPKLFLVFTFNLPVVAGSMPSLDRKHDFPSLKEAQDFARSEQGKWDFVTIYRRIDGKQGLKKLE